MAGILLIFGLIFYGSRGLGGLAWLLGITVFTYWAGLQIPKRPWILWISVAVSLLGLILARYLPGVPIPLGISYFTCMVISYNADVYRGRYPPERSLFHYLLYVTYLPHLFLGPIDRYDQLMPALLERRKCSWEGFSAGAIRFLFGLFKKLVIAERAGVLVAAIASDPGQYRGGYALLAMVLFSGQLYADFSGAMDMVLGVSRILGVGLSENFDTPFFSQTFREFWHRWHMTLGTWLRDYVYIPLGGSRRGKTRKVLNILITFLVSGLWHGLPYWLWGLLHGLLVCLGDKLKTPWKLLNRAVLFLTVSLLWAFFIWPDTLTALRMMGSVFTCLPTLSAAGVAGLGLSLGEWTLMLAGLCLLWICDRFRSPLTRKYQALGPAGRTALICTGLLLVLVFGRYGMGFRAQDFIYSRF